MLPGAACSFWRWARWWARSSAPGPWSSIFFGSAIVGALVFALLTNVRTPLVGGYPAVYGLIGAFTFILWVRLGQRGRAAGTAPSR